MAKSRALLSSVLEHLRKWFKAWKSCWKVKEVKKCDGLIVSEKEKKTLGFVLGCTGHISERTGRPASAFSLLQSKGRCSGSPPVSPRDLVNIHHQAWASAFNSRPRLATSRRRTDRWCLRRPPSARAAVPAGKPHRCNETEPGSEWLTHSPSATEKTCGAKGISWAWSEPLYSCRPTWQPSLLLPHCGSPWRCEQLPPDCLGGPVVSVWRCPSLWRYDRPVELPHTWLTSHATEAANRKAISPNVPVRSYLLSACMALAYCRCIFGEEIFGSKSPTFNLQKGKKM